jgi:four helix bundle protein
MPAAKRFEELIAWQKARELTERVFRVKATQAFERDWSFVNQMRRSAVSVGSNIAEGFERKRAREFHQFLSIAKGPCAELRSQLYTALDVGYIPLSGSTNSWSLRKRHPESSTAFASP